MMKPRSATSLRSLLKRAGYEVVATGSPDEAIAASQSYAGEIPLFVTNHRLPDGKTGREVAEELLQSRPNMFVLQISGFPEQQLVTDGSLMPGAFFLAKPFLPKQMVAKVKASWVTRGARSVAPKAMFS